MMTVIPQFVALNIWPHYRSKRIMVVPIEDDAIGRWSAAIYKLSDDRESLEEVLFDLGHYENRSREGAIQEMQLALRRAMDVTTAMAN